MCSPRPVARAEDSRQGRDGTEGPRCPLADAAPGLKGLLPHQAADPDRPRLGLERELGSQTLGPWPRQAVGRDREHDERWIGRAQPRSVEALPRVGFQTVRLDHEVGFGQERFDVWVCGRPDDRLLAGVQEGEECRVLVSQIGARRRPTAQ